MMQLGGNTLICPWFRTRVQEQSLCSNSDWPAYLKTRANRQPPRYEVAGFSKCSILFCRVPSQPREGECGRCNHCGCRCNAAQGSFYFSLCAHGTTLLPHINLKYLNFIPIKGCLQFSPQCPESQLFLSNPSSNCGRSQKLLINLLL